MRSRLTRLQQEQADVRSRLATVNHDLAAGATALTAALRLLDKPQQLFQGAGDVTRLLLTQTFFERLYIDQDDVTEVRYQPPFAELHAVSRTWRTSAAGQPAASRQTKSPDTSGAGALPGSWADLLAAVSVDTGWSKTALVEVLRRNSNNYGAVQRVGRLTHHLERQTADGRPGHQPHARAGYQPRKLSQRLSNGTVAEIVAAYQAGATTREVGERFGLAHSSVNKLLRQHGIRRRRGPRSR